MHRCLSITELQHVIFQEVCQEDPRTVARLARTCSAFSNIALNVLWAELGSFACLILCLPRDLWKVNHNKIVFRRPMSRGDWRIFFRYSSRVRTLKHDFKFKFGPRFHLGNDVILALSDPPTHGPLIPRLQELSWSMPEGNHTPLLCVLLAPSLASLSLSLCELHPPETSILTSAISSICPSLKRLTISWIRMSRRLPTEIRHANYKILSDTFLHLNALELLECPPLEEATIVHIFQLPSLLGLKLDLRDNVLPYQLPFASSSSLRMLKIMEKTLPDVTSFAQTMRFRPKSMSFFIDDTPTPDELHSCFLALSAACHSESLVHITLRSFPWPGNMLDEVSLSTFQPLLLFPNMRVFDFSVQRNIVLDDDAITTLANHWPKLTELLPNEISLGWGIASRVTHKGLLALLSRCTELTELAIEIDFTGIDVPPAGIPNMRLGGGITNHKCTRINFLASTIQYPSTIAAFLSDICPELKKVESSWGNSRNATHWHEQEVLKEKWTEVGHLLPGFVPEK